MSFESDKKQEIKQLRSLAEAMLRDAKNETLDYEEREDACSVYLESLAKLNAAGEEPTPASEPDENLVRGAVESLDGEWLSELADELQRILENVLIDPFDVDGVSAAAERAEWILQQRERFHDRVEGARKIVVDIQLNRKQQQGVDYFDLLLRPMSWALTFINYKRTGHALAAELERRRERWWWTEATNVTWDSVLHADEVAELIERYPTFAAYIDRLRRAARLRLAAAASEERATESSEVIALETWRKMAAEKKNDYTIDEEIVAAIRSWRPVAAAATAAEGETRLAWQGEQSKWHAFLRIPPPASAQPGERITLRISNAPADAYAVMLFGETFQVRTDQKGNAELMIPVEKLSTLADSEKPALVLIRSSEPKIEFGKVDS